MQIQGTVISYTAPTKIQKQGGGSYDAWELVYRSPENEVKQLAKPIQGLRFNAPLKASLESLSPNDEFSAILEKSDKGFWEVKEIVKGQVEVKDAAPAERPVAAQRAVNRVVGSTYETPEERAKKQVVIVRQSCIGYAIAAVDKFKREAPINEADILELAEQFEKFVNKGLKAAAKKYLDVKLAEEGNGE